MNTYEIIMTPDAATDLVELRNYIADVLLVPDIALAYIRTIRTEISKLANMPQRISPVPEEPWHPIGYNGCWFAVVFSCFSFHFK